MMIDCGSIVDIMLIKTMKCDGDISSMTNETWWTIDEIQCVKV